MQARKLIFVLIFLTLPGIQDRCFAQAQDTAGNEIHQLKQLMQDLQGRMGEIEHKHDAEIEQLKQQHAAEIEALRQEITRIRQAEAAPAEPKQKDEAAYLRQLAEALAQEEHKPDPAEETVFKAAGLSLQALNPEISVTGDMLGYYKHQADTRKRSDFIFRGLGLHFEAYLDPYSRFKAAVPIDENGAELGEAYFTRFGVAEGLNLTLGKFRQQFGVVNRWHKHGLDQVDFPMALRRIFGEGGLNQIGASLDWTLPSWDEASQELTFQLTNTENERLYGGDSLGNPCLLVHYKNYRDLSESTYLELGLSGLFGWNDEWSVSRAGSMITEHDALGTQVFGADCTLMWEPTERMRYRNIEWRSELYVLNRDILAPDDSGRDKIHAWGAYSYLQSKISRTVDIGVRGDYYQPDSKDYADMMEVSVVPLAYTDDDAYRWQIGPYITWQQSPFVKFRCEYDHADGHGMEKPEDVIWLQMIFAAGPHKHERY